MRVFVCRVCVCVCVCVCGGEGVLMPLSSAKVNQSNKGRLIFETVYCIKRKSTQNNKNKTKTKNQEGREARIGHIAFPSISICNRGGRLQNEEGGCQQRKELDAASEAGC